MGSIWIPAQRLWNIRQDVKENIEHLWYQFTAQQVAQRAYKAGYRDGLKAGEKCQE